MGAAFLSTDLVKEHLSLLAAKSVGEYLGVVRQVSLEYLVTREGVGKELTDGPCGCSRHDCVVVTKPQVIVDGAGDPRFGAVHERQPSTTSIRQSFIGRLCSHRLQFGSFLRRVLGSMSP